MPKPQQLARPRAVALLSGGLDSCVAAASSAAAGREVHAVTFDYGQRHRAELSAAARVAAALGVASHRVVKVDLRAIGGSALTGDLAVPKDRDVRAMVAAAEPVPVTYVPARNTIFLALALGLAETLGADRIVIGVNALDYSGYPDCREEYLRAFERMADLATAAGAEGRLRFRIDAPLVRLTKAEIVRLAVQLGAPVHLTHSCYDPVDSRGRPCNRCDACVLRRKGFEEAGVADPAVAGLARAGRGGRKHPAPRRSGRSRGAAT